MTLYLRKRYSVSPSFITINRTVMTWGAQRAGRHRIIDNSNQSFCNYVEETAYGRPIDTGIVKLVGPQGRSRHYNTCSGLAPGRPYSGGQSAPQYLTKNSEFGLYAGIGGRRNRPNAVRPVAIHYVNRDLTPFLLL